MSDAPCAATVSTTGGCAFSINVAGVDICGINFYTYLTDGTNDTFNMKFSVASF